MGEKANTKEPAERRVPHTKRWLEEALCWEVCRRKWDGEKAATCFAELTSDDDPAEGIGIAGGVRAKGYG